MVLRAKAVSYILPSTHWRDPIIVSRSSLFGRFYARETWIMDVQIIHRQISSKID